TRQGSPPGNPGVEKRRPWNTAGHLRREFVRHLPVRRPAVNPFVEHHRASIRFQYSCFDRMLLNAVVQPMQKPAMIVGFLDKYRKVPSITKAYFREVS